MGAAKIDSRKLACQGILTSGYKDMNLAQHVDTLNLLGDESRHAAVRPAARARALRDRPGAGDGHRAVAGLDAPRPAARGGVRARSAQGRAVLLRAGHGRPARPGAAVLDEAASSDDPTLDGDQQRLAELDAERRGRPARLGRRTSSSATTRPGAPGSRWRSASRRCSKLGDVLDVGSGDGAAASSLAPYCRSLTCIDTNARMIEAAQRAAGAGTRTCARAGRRRARAAVRARRRSTRCSCSTR